MNLTTTVDGIYDGRFTFVTSHFSILFEFLVHLVCIDFITDTGWYFPHLLDTK